MYMTYIWLLTAAVTLLVELGHPGLFLFCALSMGSLGAAGIAALSYPLSDQLIGFMITTGITFTLLRSFVRFQKTGYSGSVQALIGAQAIVTKRITAHHTGHVRIRGEEWLARSLHDTTIDVGHSVQVVRIERTTVIVTPHTHT